MVMMMWQTKRRQYVSFLYCILTVVRSEVTDEPHPFA